jgi:alpha-L-rhamnosidase
MQEFARIMDDTPAARDYAMLGDRLEAEMREEFWEKPVEGPINRQTLFSTLLYHKIVPEEEIPAATDSLMAALRSAPSGHITAGIFGTKYVLETLSAYASPDLVFDIVNSIDYPGWGFMIDRGATTIWETWKESDNTYSNCHPMFGSVSEWFYRWLGGIRPDPSFPGFGEFILAPSHPKGLDSVQCSYLSPHGKIISHWLRDEEGGYRYKIGIPEGSLARITLPMDPNQILALKTPGECQDPEISRDAHSASFRLAAGEYVIEVALNP